MSKYVFTSELRIINLFWQSSIVLYLNGVFSVMRNIFIAFRQLIFLREKARLSFVLFNLQNKCICSKLTWMLCKNKQLRSNLQSHYSKNSVQITPIEVIRSVHYRMKIIVPAISLMIRSQRGIIALLHFADYSIGNSGEGGQFN